MSDEAKVQLKSVRRKGVYRPVINVLVADGRVAEFKDRGLVVPEASDNPADDRVYALLINGDGEVFETPDGNPAVVAVPVLALGVAPDPDKMLSWKQVAEKVGVSLATAKRMVDDGRLPKPKKIGMRKVGFRQGDVLDALED